MSVCLRWSSLGGMFALQKPGCPTPSGPGPLPVQLHVLGPGSGDGVLPGDSEAVWRPEAEQAWEGGTGLSKGCQGPLSPLRPPRTQGAAVRCPPGGSRPSRPCSPVAWPALSCQPRSGQTPSLLPQGPSS